VRSHRATLGALLLIGVTACGGRASSNHLSDVTGTWVLNAIDGAPVVIGVDAGRAPWVQIISFLWWQRIRGDDGCNSVLAKDLSFSDDVLHPRDTVITTMRCLDENGVDFVADRVFDRVFFSEDGISVTIDGQSMSWEGSETTLTFQRVDEVH
jgi:hypothetical protein